MRDVVYLAGPISGCEYGECVDWREAVGEELEKWGAECLSPMRGKDYLKGIGPIESVESRGVLSCSRGVITRDFNDCSACDVLLVNLLGTKRVSIGTVMEIAWAFQKRTPVVCVMEASNNLHDHAMLREAIGFRVETMGEAIAVVRTILDLREW